MNDDDHPYLNGPYPRAFAHRGWHLDDLAGMENSLSAFRRAVDEGFRYLETDVHATSDGVVVVQHDERLDRTTDRVGEVATLPWREVRRARIAGVERPCLLEELLEDLPRALINVDVKSDGAVRPVLDVLRKAHAYDRVCLASFSDRRLATIRRLGPPAVLTSLGPHSVRALWLAGRMPVLPWHWMIRGRMAQVPVRYGDRTVAERRLVRAAHRSGREVHVWTVDEPEDMRRLLGLGVDGLVTDRPDLLRAVLRDDELPGSHPDRMPE